VRAKTRRKAECFDFSFLLPFLPLFAPFHSHLDVRVWTLSTRRAACMVEVEADAATSDRIPRHTPEARGLVGEEGREGTREEKNIN
jgi:hypothetical protein